MYSLSECFFFFVSLTPTMCHPFAMCRHIALTLSISSQKDPVKLLFFFFLSLYFSCLMLLFHHEQETEYTHFSCRNFSKWWWLWWVWSSGRCQSICLFIISHFFLIGKSQMSFFKVAACRYYLGVNNIWRKEISMVKRQGGSITAHCALIERMRRAQKHNHQMNTWGYQMWCSYHINRLFFLEIGCFRVQAFGNVYNCHICCYSWNFAYI